MKSKKVKYRNHIVELAGKRSRDNSFLIKIESGWDGKSNENQYDRLDIKYMSREEFLKPDNCYWWVSPCELKSLPTIKISIK